MNWKRWMWAAALAAGSTGLTILVSLARYQKCDPSTAGTQYFFLAIPLLTLVGCGLTFGWWRWYLALGFTVITLALWGYWLVFVQTTIGSFDCSCGPEDLSNAWNAGVGMSLVMSPAFVIAAVVGPTLREYRIEPDREESDNADS